MKGYDYMMLKKKEKNQNQTKERMPLVYKINTHRRSVIILWVILGASLLFAIYKNFTAINKHTIHETKVVEKEIIDTHKIENFVINFAKVYYAWEQTADSMDNRNHQIQNFVTAELYALNTDTVRKDISTSSVVNNVQIWSVTQDKKNQYSVTFTVEQLITEGETQKSIFSAFKVMVYVDESGNMVITRNPTICSIPEKSDYEPKAAENDGTVDAATIEEVNEFLTTFFTLYPKATKKELSYYVNNGVLQTIERDYVFAELINPIYSKIENQVQVSVSVKYLDEETKAIQISQFNLILEKKENWIIKDVL